MGGRPELSHCTRDADSLGGNSLGLPPTAPGCEGPRGCLGVRPRGGSPPLDDPPARGTWPRLPPPTRACAAPAARLR